MAVVYWRLEQIDKSGDCVVYGNKSLSRDIRLLLGRSSGAIKLKSLFAGWMATVEVAPLGPQEVAGLGLLAACGRSVVDCSRLRSLKRVLFHLIDLLFWPK